MGIYEETPANGRSERNKSGARQWRFMVSGNIIRLLKYVLNYTTVPLLGTS